MSSSSVIPDMNNDNCSIQPKIEKSKDNSIQNSCPCFLCKFRKDGIVSKNIYAEICRLKLLQAKFHSRELFAKIREAPYDLGSLIIMSHYSSIEDAVNKNSSFTMFPVPTVSEIKSDDGGLLDKIRAKIKEKSDRNMSKHFIFCVCIQDKASTESKLSSKGKTDNNLLRPVYHEIVCCIAEDDFSKLSKLDSDQICSFAPFSSV